MTLSSQVNAKKVLLREMSSLNLRKNGKRTTMITMGRKNLMIIREVDLEEGEEDVRGVDIKISRSIKERKNGTLTGNLKIEMKTGTNTKTSESKVFRTTSGKRTMITKGRNITTVTIGARKGTQTKTIPIPPKNMKALTTTTIDVNKKTSPKTTRRKTIIWARLEVRLSTMMRILTIE